MEIVLLLAFYALLLNEACFEEFGKAKNTVTLARLTKKRIKRKV